MTETYCENENVQRFLSSTAAWEEAYAHPAISFLAISHEGTWIILQCRLFLQTTLGAIPRKSVKTAHIAVGHIAMTELGITYREFINKIITSQEVQTPIGAIRFPLEQGTAVTTHFAPFHSEGIATGNRLPVLTVSGARWQQLLQQPDIDWELAAIEQPYETLNELLYEFSLGTYRSDYAVLEVVAHSVAMIDFSSKVSGDVAEPSILLASSADPAKAGLGYRVLLHGKVVDRGQLSGDALTWTQRGSLLHGVGEVKIPSGAAMQCFALYAGYAHHKGWIADPALSQNARRAAFEEFDVGLTVLKDFLFEENRARKDARDFEVGVAWLLWMLGLGVAHAGGSPRTSEAADILASTPSGHIAVIECTTGHLKAESKLSRLVARSKTIRRRLDDSGNRHLKILPVIVTALGKEEIKADLDQARSLGIFVVTREDLLAAVNQTITSHNVDQEYSRALESLSVQQSVLSTPAASE